MILVTGVNGFVGKHLTRELVQHGHQVVGIGNREPQAHPEIADILTAYYRCDITVPDEVANLELANISAVINLAGLANVGASFDNPDLYMSVNVKVLSVLGEAFLRANLNGRMVAISSGALYDPNQPMPLSEHSKTVSSGSPYALSKLAMEDAAQDLRNKGLDCIVARPFNHIGPGQGLGFLIPDLANKLKNTDPTNPTISAGNLKTIRDYSDVRDIVSAYAMLATAEKLESNLFNVCSGNGKSGEDIVKALCASLNIDFGNLTIEVDQSLIRPTDPAKIVGDSSRLQAETGWRSKIKLEQTVQDIVNSLQS